MLRSLGVLGAAAATPAVLGGCRGSTQPSGRTPLGPPAGLALANVARSTGGEAARPQAVSAVRAFSADLYRKLATEPGNVVCSPYSVSVALAMTWNGARGVTGSEIQDVLHAPGLQRFNQGLDSLARLVESRAGRVERSDGSHGLLSLDVANSLWGQTGLRWEKQFLGSLARYYGTGMRLVDYVRAAEGARGRINAWTADQTHDRIPEIIGENVLDEMTRLVLVNAIYLKAPWETPFFVSGTRSQPFTRSDGSRVDADMMVTGLSSGLRSGPGWRAVTLPYAGGKLAMTVVLPDGSLDEVESGLDDQALALMLDVESPGDALVLHLPRWEFRLAAMLTEQLEDLGMRTAFNPARADFSAMTTDDELSVGAVVHQAFISVDEHGTEAAAATAVVAIAGSAAASPPDFVVDRPFLFLIHDVETATPLFIGRVEDPTKE